MQGQLEAMRITRQESAAHGIQEAGSSAAASGSSADSVHQPYLQRLRRVNFFRGQKHL